MPDPTRFELHPSHVNNRFQVRVRCTDDAGYSEWLVSEETAPVAEAPDPQGEGSSPSLPTAKAGPDLTGAPGESVTLQGKGSTNPYGKWYQMAHQWTQLSGPAVTLTHPRKTQPASKFGDPRFTLPADVAAGTTLEFQLTVTDKEDESDSDTMTVTVPGAEPEPANTPPTASIDAAQVTAGVAGETVALQGVGGDADLRLEPGGRNARGVHRQRKRGHGRLHRPGRDRGDGADLPPDGDRRGRTVSQRRDNHRHQPAARAGEHAAHGVHRRGAGHGGRGRGDGTPLTATDQDSDTLAYSRSGADADAFDIDASTGQLLTKAGVTYDYETRATYSVTVAVTVSLTDVNERPSATSCFTNLNELTASVEYAGAWDDADCRAHHRDGPARYFHFTLSQETTVEINLESAASAQLFVSKDTPRNGWGKRPNSTYQTRRTIRRNNGKLVHDGAHTGLNGVTLTLAAGKYTAEATGPASDGTPGTFTLNIKPQ